MMNSLEGVGDASADIDFAAVVDSLGAGVLILGPDSSFQSANAAARRIFELDARALAATEDLTRSLRLVDAEGNFLAPEQYPDKIAARTGRPVSDLVVGFDRTDGQRVWLWCNVGLIEPDRPGESAIAALFSDITDQHAARARLQYAADHDLMTGLPNRAFVISCLRQALESCPARRSNETLSTVVMFIDLDSLKQVNDSMGHGGGDVALITAAKRLRSVMPDNGIVGRFGGDEFVAVISDVSSADTVTELSDRVHAALMEPVIVQGRLLRIRASVGIVEVAAGDTTTPAEAIYSADTAMYQAKTAGGGHTVVFGSDSSESDRRTQAQ
jgi:diguanylate cyclase (GGDEF)-like protein